MPSFLDTSNFLNVYYALNIAIETHFANLGLGGDLGRVVYAKKDFCFRKRIEQVGSQTTNLDFPFMQYAITNISPNTSRGNYFNNLANISGGGIWMEGSGKKVRIAPIKVEYSLNYFFQRLDDTLFCYNKLILDNSNETILYPSLTMKDIEDEDYTFPVPAFLNYSNFDINSDAYSSSENDWLVSNHINVLEISGISFDTVALTSDDAGDVSLTEEVILNFLATKENYSGTLDDIDSVDPQALITSYFSEDD